MPLRTLHFGRQDKGWSVSLCIRPMTWCSSSGSSGSATKRRNPGVPVMALFRVRPRIMSRRIPSRGDQAVLQPAREQGISAGRGAALLAQHLTTWPTEDLNFFTGPVDGHVPAARDTLEAAARKRLGHRAIHGSDTFYRLVIRSDTAEVVTDLAVDTPPDFPASTTAAGPTLAPEELAGRKLGESSIRVALRRSASALGGSLTGSPKSSNGADMMRRISTPAGQRHVIADACFSCVCMGGRGNG